MLIQSPQRPVAAALLVAAPATAAYNGLLTDRLSSTLAVWLEGISRESEADFWVASALAGARYSI